MLNEHSSRASSSHLAQPCSATAQAERQGARGRGAAGCGGGLIGRRALACCQELSKPVPLWAEAVGQLCGPRCVLGPLGAALSPPPSALCLE